MDTGFNPSHGPEPGVEKPWVNRFGATACPVLPGAVKGPETGVKAPGKTLLGNHGISPLMEWTPAKTGWQRGLSVSKNPRKSVQTGGEHSLRGVKDRRANSPV